MGIKEGEEGEEEAERTGDGLTLGEVVAESKEEG